MADSKTKQSEGNRASYDGFTSYFRVEPQKHIILPPFKDKKEIDVRYALIAPFAFAHIFWDPEEDELVYEVEEPQLSDDEKTLLKTIKIALEERINISYVGAVKSGTVIAYLESNLQSILLELGFRISKDSYLKLMYYIYRDFIGLDKIEPLMRDFFIEDIECNGIQTPVYIVHRKYENIRTNIIFYNLREITDFVEKLSQKCGRYVSYAKPLLDGTLPDGSRVNATYTGDITTRGPTFTIRKFTKEPWTPVSLMEFNTANAEIFAYLWLAIENKMNIMVIGETASGKTSFLNSILYFIPPEARINSIEDTREINLAHANWLPAVTRLGFGIPSASGQVYGEIELFDLLKESFRQAPDYVIVGEIRGKEAAVLFQGMASGHPSFGTMHAGSIETLIERLRTPPISLPASLVNSLDIVCIMSHIKGKEKNIRRLVEVDEIIHVEEAGASKYNKLLVWNPVTDSFIIKEDSVVLQKISQRTGMSISAIKQELSNRAKLLRVLSMRKITDFKKFTSIIKKYYEIPEVVIKEYGLG